MRIPILPTVALLLAGTVCAQDPKPVVTPPPAGTEKVQDPEKEGPKKEGTKEQDPKAEKPKAQEAGKGGPASGETKEDPKKQDPKKDVTEVDLPKDQPLPPSGDPADLRAMKSAQDMVAAERRLRARIKAGKIKDIDKLLSFEEISSWPYEDGLKGMPKAVKELDGRQVVMIGFMLPIDEVEDIKEFLLVQSLWACCYGQPPDINGIVRVVMKGDRRCDYQFDPILVKGTFDVEATLEDGYCIDIYQLHATEVSLLK